jgi:hypothetical protein
MRELDHPILADIIKNLCAFITGAISLEKIRKNCSFIFKKFFSKVFFFNISKLKL